MPTLIKCRICGETRGYHPAMRKHFEDEHSRNALDNYQDKTEKVERSPVWQGLPES